MTDSKSKTTQLKADTDGLAGSLRQFGQKKLKSGQTLTKLSQDTALKQAAAKYQAVKAQVAITATIASIADQIGLKDWPHSNDALKGGMLTMLDSADDPEAIARYIKRNKEFTAKKRPKSPGIVCCVRAAVPSDSLGLAAKNLKLRYDDMLGGFRGRAEPKALADIGRTFQCTVRVKVDKEQHDLVKHGEVDTALLERLIRGAPYGESGSSPKPLPHLNLIDGAPGADDEASSKPSAQGEDSTSAGKSAVDPDNSNRDNLQGLANDRPANVSGHERYGGGRQSLSLRGHANRK